MPRPRVRLELLTASSLDADTALASVDGDLVGRNVFDRLRPLDKRQEEGSWRVAGDIRFGDAADAAGFLQSIQDKWNGPLSAIMLAGSRATRHLCAHGEAEEWNCQSDPRAQFTERTK